MEWLKKGKQRFWLPVALIIVLGLGLRLLNLEKTAFFDADQENFAWTAVRLLEERRPVLVGLKAGEFPVFIGPLMYYVYSLFLWVFGMDPLGLSYFSILVAGLTLISVCWVGWQVFGRKVGMLAGFLYAFSSFFVFLDRRIWLPGPLILVSVWVFYFLAQAKSKDLGKQLIFLGLLFSLGFQLHITALFFLPIIILGLMIKGLRPSWSALFKGIGAACLGILPVVAFDLRHGFINFRGWLSLFTKAGEKHNLWQRLLDLVRFNLENQVRIFSLPINTITLVIAGIFFLTWGANLLKKNELSQKLRLASLWIVVPLIIFLPLKLHTPEYYFIISFPIFLLVTASLLTKFSREKLLQLPLAALLLVFWLVNSWAVVNQETDDLISLYEKKRTVDHIINQSQTEDFSLFYDMDRGYNYGYDYLFYYRLGFVPPKEETADYTIVVPWDYGNQSLTKRFGAIGVKVAE